MTWLRKHLFDWFWPTIEPPSREESVQEEPARTARRDALMLNLRGLTTADEVQAAREQIQSVESSERDRMTNVEERLRGLVSLAAVAAAVTVGIGIAQLRGDLQSTASGTLLALASVYAVVQLLAALLAAIKGLERRSFRAVAAEDLIARPTEDPRDRELRLSEISFDAMIDVQDAANAKVDQMSLAYRALKNFVFGVLVAALVLLIAQTASGAPAAARAASAAHHSTT